MRQSSKPPGTSNLRCGSGSCRARGSRCRGGRGCRCRRGAGSCGRGLYPTSPSTNIYVACGSPRTSTLIVPPPDIRFPVSSPRSSHFAVTSYAVVVVLVVVVVVVVVLVVVVVVIEESHVY